MNYTYAVDISRAFYMILCMMNDGIVFLLFYVTLITRFEGLLICSLTQE